MCCIYLRINTPQLQKEGMRHCPHVITDEPEEPGQKVCYTGRGCSLYGKHPDVCQGYRCEWLKGYGQEEDRPDRSGILADRSKGIEGAVECKPIWDGAAEAAAGRQAIERISRDSGQVALVTSFYERRLVRVVGRPWE